MSTRDEVTTILNRLRGLLGDGTPVTAPLPSTVPADIQARLDALPDGLGKLIQAYIGERKSQAEIAEELSKIDPSLTPVVDESGTNVLEARNDIDNIEQNYADRRDQLAPIEGTPLGQVAVLQSKIDAVGNGAESVRAQTNPAELRRAIVDRLAQRYYQQAKAAMSGAGGSLMGSGGGGSPGGAPGGGSPGGGGGGMRGSPLSSLAQSLAPALSQNQDQRDARGREIPRLAQSAGGSAAGRKMAEKALTALGAPYVWGAEGPNTFDCSGLVQWATADTTGHVLPRTTYDQVNLGVRINPADARPGDLVFSRFFSKGPEHVQIALGPDKVVHAPQSGDVVKISPMPNNVIVKRIL